MNGVRIDGVYKGVYLGLVGGVGGGSVGEAPVV